MFCSMLLTDTNTLHTPNTTPSPPPEPVLIRQVKCSAVQYDIAWLIVFDMYCRLIDKHISVSKLRKYLQVRRKT